MTPQESQQRVRDVLQAGDSAQLRAVIGDYWMQHRSPATAAWLTRTLKSHRGRLDLPGCRVAMLRSFTVEPSVPMLTAAALAGGIDLEIHVGQFNQYALEILNPQSDLYAFQPDITILAVLTEAIAPELWTGFNILDDASLGHVVDRVTDEYRTLMQTFRQQSDATLIVHTLEPPRWTSNGIADTTAAVSQRAAITEINSRLRRVARDIDGICLLDHGALVQELGARHWYDDARGHAMGLPMSTEAVDMLTHEWMKYIHALTTAQCKVLVCDLDNTLWSGIVGEDGPEGLRMGPGTPHRQVQQAALDLFHRGIILAACSKNNHDDAWDVISSHPDMLLRPEHFASIRINWQDKPTNLQEIAAELNVGIDSLAFLDDSPTERLAVRTMLPQVTVLPATDDARQYATLIRGEPRFERAWLTVDDRRRGAMYAGQRERRALRETTTDLNTYLHSLETVMEIVRVDPLTVERIAQLTQKTNQFNLTTRRYTPQQITSFDQSTDSEVLGFSVSDRFGDNGIVGVAILTYTDSSAEIDTLLLSCRVIGRSVETAMLATIAEMSRARGCNTLKASFIPTAKNAPAESFLPDHGFVLDEESAAWRRSLEESLPEVPRWIRVASTEPAA